MDSYIKRYHDKDVISLMNDEQSTILGDLTNLERVNTPLFEAYIKDPFAEQIKWQACLLSIQYAYAQQENENSMFLDTNFQIKPDSHIRFTNLPPTHEGFRFTFPGRESLGKFVQLKGVIIRVSLNQFLETKKEYKCGKCKETFVATSEYKTMYHMESLTNCLTPLCQGRLTDMNELPKAELMLDYQEVRLQEMASEIQKPNALIVSLENDLTNTIFPGQCVTVCGKYEARWGIWCQPNKDMEVFTMLRATSIKLEDTKSSFGRDLEEVMVGTRAQWEADIDAVGMYAARDCLIRSICPEVRGMYLVKLAVALSLATNVERNGDDGVRRQSHLLLVGDPGLAKSRILKFAAKMVSRAVHTNGDGISAAGLTAAAVKDEGEWTLEGGALVLANGGVCCIDEFNLMQEHDKGALHEAMEQQVISISKANLKCKLQTRCVIIAATNPKNLYNMSEKLGTSTINIGIATPLLSRFDLIMILRDEANVEWDEQITDHILLDYRSADTSATPQSLYGDDLWDLEKLQAHFMALQEIDPAMTDEAKKVLTAYYKACRSEGNADRDQSRTSIRLLDSLYRLAQGHARLLMQNRVTVLDAVSIIRLMEASWGFGRLICADHLIRQAMPLGPNQQQTEEVLNGLQQAHLLDSIPAERFDELYKPKKDSQEVVAASQPRTKKRLEISIADVFSDSDEDSDDGGDNRTSFRDTEFPDDLDELLRLDDDLKVKFSSSDEDDVTPPKASEVVQEPAKPSSVVSFLHGRFAFSQVNQKKMIKSSNTKAPTTSVTSSDEPLEEEQMNNDLLSIESSFMEVSPKKTDTFAASKLESPIQADQSPSPSKLHGRFAFSQVNQKKRIKSSDTEASTSTKRPKVSPLRSTTSVSSSDGSVEEEQMNNILLSIENSFKEVTPKKTESFAASKPESPSPSNPAAKSLIQKRTIEKLNKFCFVEREDSPGESASGKEEEQMAKTDSSDEEEINLDFDNIQFEF